MKGKLLLVGLVVLSPYVVHAQVVINEIAWMGTVASASDEWMELYNNGSDAISLDGWKLESTSGTPSITLSGNIPAGGFFLLERTDDTSVPNIAADIIYTGPLSNMGEHLVLRDASGAVVDEVKASGGWPAGNNDTKNTMQRSGLSWVTKPATPKAPTPIVAVAVLPVKQVQVSDTKTLDMALPNSAPKEAAHAVSKPIQQAVTFLAQKDTLPLQPDQAPAPVPGRSGSGTLFEGQGIWLGLSVLVGAIAAVALVIARRARHL